MGDQSDPARTKIGNRTEPNESAKKMLRERSASPKSHERCEPREGAKKIIFFRTRHIIWRVRSARSDTDERSEKGVTVEGIRRAGER